jgi:hypothetical protein
MKGGPSFPFTAANHSAVQVRYAGRLLKGEAISIGFLEIPTDNSDSNTHLVYEKWNLFFEA